MKFTAGLIAAILCSGICRAGDMPELTSESEKINYSVGFQIGRDFKKQGVDINSKAIVRGIEDAAAGGRTLMTQDEMRSTLVNLKKRIIAEQTLQQKAAAEKYRHEGAEFLAGNAKKEGVVALSSGVQYKVIREGSGKKPSPNDTLTVLYRGTLIDGTEFDSTYRDNKPATLSLDQAIPGWKEALPLMKEGSKWQVFIPGDLAFGERGPLADRTVIYEIELLAVKPAQ